MESRLKKILELVVSFLEQLIEGCGTTDTPSITRKNGTNSVETHLSDLKILRQKIRKHTSEVDKTLIDKKTPSKTTSRRKVAWINTNNDCIVLFL